MTEEELEKGKSPKGGWTKNQLAKWGVPWPPPKGWKETLLANNTELFEITAAQQLQHVTVLLRLVVMQMIDTGHADKLYNVPGLLDYFGAKTPTREELEAAGCTYTPPS